VNYASRNAVRPGQIIFTEDDLIHQHIGSRPEAIPAYRFETELNIRQKSMIPNAVA